jgi:signal transduction histidine kinase
VSLKRPIVLAAASVLVGSMALSSHLTAWDCLRAGGFALLLLVALEVGTRHRRAEIDAVVTRERRRLAADLHDGMAQDLALIAAHEPRLTQDLGAEHPVAVAARQALATARGAIVDLSASAEPTTTDALQAVAGELSRRHGVRVDVDAAPENLVGDHREAVVRIAREAIVNAVRHGGAANVRVRLRTDGDQLLLRIDDDGRGLPQPIVVGTRSGYGLREMRNWAERIGGQLTTQPGVDGGTAVKVSVS